MNKLARTSAVALAVSIALSAAVSSAAPLPGSSLTSLNFSVPDAIIGGDKDAIIGGDKDAIIGGDKDAIIGGDTDAIIGGDKDAIIGGDLLAAIPPDLLIWGPIESVDPVKKTVVVLGQRLKAHAAGAFLHELQVDRQAGNVSSVAVSGKLKPNGQLDSAAMRILDKPYAAGSDVVIVSGKIKSVDMSRGKAAIGGLEIDYSQLLSVANPSLQIGDLLVVVGTQPVLLGTVYAQALRVVSQAN